MPDSFAGKTALITGAASGIGAACARWLDAHGIARLVLVDRDAAGLDALELSCEADRHQGDVSDPDFWQRLEADLDRLDHAVVNAGIAAGAPIAEERFEQWRRILAVNLDGAFLTLATALRLMLKGGRGGSAVLLSSITGVKPMAGTGAYGASKAALAHLARIAALENAAHGIRVNAIAPGGVDTPIWDSDPNFRQLAADQGRDAAIAGFAAALRSAASPPPTKSPRRSGFCCRTKRRTSLARCCKATGVFRCKPSPVDGRRIVKLMAARSLAQLG